MKVLGPGEILPNQTGAYDLAVLENKTAIGLVLK
jgi:hypothetical protein